MILIYGAIGTAICLVTWGISELVLLLLWLAGVHVHFGGPTPWVVPADSSGD